jgi:hypothetical protein
MRDAVRRQRSFDILRRAERVVLALGEGGVELARGRLVRAWSGDSDAGPAETGGPPAGSDARAAFGPIEPPPDDGALPAALADELSCIAAWLDRHAHRLRPVHVEGELSSTLPHLAPPALLRIEPEGGPESRRPGLRCAAC